MVSRSIYAYLLNKEYHHFELDWYGCPESLGQKIVNNLRSYSPEDLHMLSYYLSRIRFEDCLWHIREVIDFISLMHSAKSPRENGYIRTCKTNPRLTSFVRHVYIIDLDSQQLTIVSKCDANDHTREAMFPFGSIPEDWLKILYDSEEDSESEFENSDSDSADTSAILTA